MLPAEKRKARGEFPENPAAKRPKVSAPALSSEHSLAIHQTDRKIGEEDMDDAKTATGG
jgi:hypothetical protein